MTVPIYQSISILSYSPVAGVRCGSFTSNETLRDLDARGPMYLADSNQLATLTSQSNSLLRLKFAFRALDNAPSQEIKALIPLEAFILHYARDTHAWGSLKGAPALNMIVLDWPVTDGYETRVYLVGMSGPFLPAQLPFFYEQRREEASAELRKTMPLPVFS